MLVDELYCWPKELKMMLVHLLESYGVRTLLNRSEEGLCRSFVRSFRGRFQRLSGKAADVWVPVLVSPSFVSAPFFSAHLLR